MTGRKIVRASKNGVEVVEDYPSSRPQTPTLPPFREQAKGFSQALKDHAKNGFKQADPETAKQRFEVCRACPELIGGKRCSICGCFMERKSKWAETRCPLNKW